MSEFSLAEVVLGQSQYASLRQFFIDSWDSAYAYRVYISRRAFNLNEIFFKEEYDRRKSVDSNDAARLKITRNNTFLTQNALLARMRQLTSTYIETKIFPRILIVDELIIYGREINALMQTLETAALSAWESEMGTPPSDSESWLLHNALISAVDLRIYGCNSEPQLLENHLTARLKTARLMSGSEWREYTQRVSRLISQSDLVDNTCYTPSYIFRKSGYGKLISKLRSTKWLSLGTSKKNATDLKGALLLYHGAEVTVWQRNAFPDDPEVHLHLTLRCYLGTNHTVRVIPLPVFGDITEDSLSDLFSGIATLIKGELSEKSTLFSLLQNQEPLLRPIKLQLISCILSIIIMRECLPKKEGDKQTSLQLISNGLEKAAQNFGVISETYNELKIIDDKEEFRTKLQTFLYGFLRSQTRAISQITAVTPEDFERDVCLKHADEFFYQVGQQDEEYVRQLHLEKGLYNAWTQPTMEALFDEYLASFEQSKIKNCSFEAKIATLLPLMDQGVVAMSMNSNGISLKVGEQSKFCRARQLYRFIPALIELERHCSHTGESLSSVAGQFGRYLEEKFPGEYFEHLFTNFVREVTRYGQTVQDWDIDLIVGLDQPNRERHVRRVQEWSNRDWGSEWETIDQKSYIQYLFWERKNQEIYKQFAISFCAS